MASASVARDVILTPERTLDGGVSWRDEKRPECNSLCFKLIRKDQVCMVDHLLVGRNNIIIDV